MNRIFILLLIALFLSLVMRFLLPQHAYHEHLIRLQLEQTLPVNFADLDQESTETQAIFLDYSQNTELVLKAQLALLKYPEKTRQILSLYGSEPAFREILLRYGETVIPIIDYFLTSDPISSIKLIDQAGKAAETLKDWWYVTTDKDNATTVPWSVRQGWYAIHFIQQEGHDFLGQFVLDPVGAVKWIQTERISEGLAGFFTSGIEQLETRYVTDQAITSHDLLWAGVDVLAVAGTLKLLRAGRQAARSGRSISLTRQTTLYGSRLLKSGMAGKLFKYSAIAATAWLVITHPGLVNSLLAEAGHLLGIPPVLAQIAGLSLLAFVLLFPLLSIMKWLITPAIRLTRLILTVLFWLQGRLSGTLKKHPTYDRPLQHKAIPADASL